MAIAIAAVAGNNSDERSNAANTVLFVHPYFWLFFMQGRQF
jgi:hypothetical protein